MIPFNKPFLSGNELTYIRQAVETGKISGNGIFTEKCHAFFEKRYGFNKCLLTTSCTDALEMAAILLDIKPGDEVIMPSFTFVSTANAFVLRGAKIIFADSRNDHPGINENSIEQLITPKTKAIVVVHYAGVACDMDAVMNIANKYSLFVVEDAAQAIDNYYLSNDGVKGALGGIGHLAAFSFHETKNIISGEGGMLVINDKSFEERAEIIWEKGTNRSAFFKGKIDKYGWIDIGSSFLPSEIISAFLFAQLENIDVIQNKRKFLWQCYNERLKNYIDSKNFLIPQIPHYSTNNGHMFYLILKNIDQRGEIIDKLKHKNIMAVSHYSSLHKSFFNLKNSSSQPNLCNSDRFSSCLLRLPLYYELTEPDIDEITQCIIS